MKLIKNRNLKYLFIGTIVILVLFMNVIDSRSQEQAIEPITYDFNNDSIFDIDQEYNPNYYNIRNQTEYLGNYKAEYSFQNELGYEGLDISFLDYTSGNVIIEQDFKGHSYYMDSSNGITIANYFQETYVFSLELWIYIIEPDLSTLRFYEGLVRIVDIYWHSNGQFIYQDSGGYQQITVDFPIKNWTHYRIDIFSNNTFGVYINSIFIGQDYECLNSMVNGVDELRFTIGANYHQHFDAIDYSFSSGYTPFRNFIPISENTGQLEVDKFEFDYEYEIFENDYYDWIQTEASTYNYIQVIGTKDIDKYMAFNMFYGAIYSQELHYEPNSNSRILNISMAINPSSISIYDYQFIFYLKPHNYVDLYDSISFRIKDSNDNFNILNQETESYEYMFDIVQDNTIYINIYINSYDNIYIFSIYNSVDYFETVYKFDIDNKDLYGFTDLYFYGFANEPTNPSSFNCNIYDVGIYEYGKSIISKNNTNEFGLMYYGIDDSWNSDNHNLLTIDSNNYYDTYIHNYYDYFLDGYLIDSKFNQSQLRVINLQDSFDNNYPKFIYSSSYLIFKIFGNCTNFYEIEIEGVQLIDNNGNGIYGNYYYNNTDSNYNWFYAIDNKLYYEFNHNDSVGLETMRIIFNVYDILLDNESLISYSSYITNNYTGNIYVSSYYITETFSISNNETLQNTYLNMTDLEHFTIKEISIEVQSSSYSSGLADGYIQNINVYPERPLFPDFEPIEYLDSTFLEKMLETMIPILFFIIPSFMMKTSFGNKAVIPIWLLLTFILLIVNFIPFWIAFIIFLGIGLMAFNKDEVFE